MFQALLPAIIIVSACFSSGAFLVWLFEASPARHLLATCQGLGPPVLGIVAVMFSLLSAFMSSDVWSRRAQAVTAVQTEASGLRTMLRVADAIGPVALPLRAAALEYARIVVVEEWPTLASRDPHDLSAPATQRLFDLVLTDSGLLAQSAGAQGMLREALSRVRDARTQRLRLAGEHIAPGNWLALSFLAVLTQTVLCAVHVGSRRPMIFAMLFLSAAIGTVLSMLGLNDRPFFGFAAVTDASFAKILLDFPAR